MKKQKENPVVAALLFSLIPAVFYTLYLVLAPTLDKPSAVPTYDRLAWNIHASYAKAFADGLIPALVVLGYIIGIGGPLVYNLKNAGLGAGEGDRTPVWVYFLCWLIGLILIIAPVGYIWTHVDYETLITNEQYQLLKENLDSLFPDGN